MKKRSIQSRLQNYYIAKERIIRRVIGKINEEKETLGQHAAKKQQIEEKNDRNIH